MQLSLWIPIVSAIISVIAVTLSLIALWKTHFSKFSFIPVVGSLRMRIYPIKNENKRWFIPSFDLPISITNEGARPGKILGLRLSVSFPNLPIPDNRECFYPKWEVDAKLIDHNRFKWIEEATIADWMPFVILPKATVTKHLVFESRWSEPVIQEQVDCVLEIYTSVSSEWSELGKWKLRLTPKVWSELVNVGTCFSFPSETDVKILEDRIYPSDLHKYTGTKQPIPEKGLGAGPSYLDYPKQSAEIAEKCGDKNDA